MEALTKKQVEYLIKVIHQDVAIRLSYGDTESLAGLLESQATARILGEAIKTQSEQITITYGGNDDYLDPR